MALTLTGPHVESAHCSIHESLDGPISWWSMYWNPLWLTAIQIVFAHQSHNIAYGQVLFDGWTFAWVYHAGPYFRQVSVLLQCSVCISISSTGQNNSCDTPLPVNLAIESLSWFAILSCHSWNFGWVSVLLQCATCTSNSPTTQSHHPDPPLPTNLPIELFSQLAIRDPPKYAMAMCWALCDLGH